MSYFVAETSSSAEVSSAAQSSRHMLGTGVRLGVLKPALQV